MGEQQPVLKNGQHHQLNSTEAAHRGYRGLIHYGHLAKRFVQLCRLNSQLRDPTVIVLSRGEQALVSHFGEFRLQGFDFLDAVALSHKLESVANSVPTRSPRKSGFALKLH